jgi:hypothetical protein
VVIANTVLKSKTNWSQVGHGCYVARHGPVDHGAVTIA